MAQLRTTNPLIDQIDHPSRPPSNLILLSYTSPQPPHIFARYGHGHGNGYKTICLVNQSAESEYPLHPSHPLFRANMSVSTLPRPPHLVKISTLSHIQTANHKSAETKFYSKHITHSPSHQPSNHRLPAQRSAPRY